ncbi:MAG: YigZ family protein [Candidatus Latescibacterota bacterium]|nr:MAG: YigZ family protein [Candidatus Latescibacterota bacterium]
MSDPDVYRALAEEGESETRVLGSRFLGIAAPIGGEEEAAERIDRLRRKHHDATHVCFAWRLGHGAGAKGRSSDAGEPSGTAGAPILAAIERAAVSDALVAVVRWFGGTKLGTGGLARAYGDSARLALDAARTEERVVREMLAFVYAYPLSGRVLRLAEKHGALVEDTSYGDEVRLVLAVPRSRLAALRADLADATAGAVRFEK